MLKKYLSKYKGIKVLVTGSTGFKGAWLSYWLHILGAKVIGVGLKPEKGSIIFKSLNLKRKIKQHYLNINDFKKINRVIEKNRPRIIFHLAAQSIVSESFLTPLNTFNTNVIGSINILESFKKNKILSLVYITSDKCYLNLDKNKNFKENDTLGGIDNYSASKACAEIAFNSYHNSYFKQKNLIAVTARAGNVIGGGDLKQNRIIPDVIRSIKTKKNIILRSPNATRPWQHVLEPLSGYLLLGSKLMSKKIGNKFKPNWNFGPNPKNSKKVIYIVKKFLENWNFKNKIIINKKINYHESKLLSLNINKAKTELGWKPRLSFEETVKLTSDWYKAFLDNKNLESITHNQIKFYLSKK